VYLLSRHWIRGSVNGSCSTLSRTIAILVKSVTHIGASVIGAIRSAESFKDPLTGECPRRENGMGELEFSNNQRRIHIVSGIQR
jgi:hypothetical protein